MPPGVVSYGGPPLRQLGRDGLVNSEDHFVFLTVGAEPACFSSSIFLGTGSTSYTHISVLSVYARMSVK